MATHAAVITNMPRCVLIYIHTGIFQESVAVKGEDDEQLRSASGEGDGDGEATGIVTDGMVFTA